MFENLQEKLQRAFKNLRGQGTLTPENIQEALKEIRLALLEADVNFKVVKQLIDHIQEKAVGQEVMTSLSPAQQVIKIVHDELVNILGRDTAKLKFASQPPTVVLMAGAKGRRFSLPSATIHMHQPLIGGKGLQGQASDLDIHAREIVRIRTVLNELIAKHTGQALERVERDTDRDFFLNPEEAVEYGLIDGLIQQTPVPVLASTR